MEKKNLALNATYEGWETKIHFLKFGSAHCTLYNWWFLGAKVRTFDSVSLNRILEIFGLFLVEWVPFDFWSLRTKILGFLTFNASPLITIMCTYHVDYAWIYPNQLQNWKKYGLQTSQNCQRILEIRVKMGQTSLRAIWEKSLNFGVGKFVEFPEFSGSGKFAVPTLE